MWCFSLKKNIYCVCISVHSQDYREDFNGFAGFSSCESIKSLILSVVLYLFPLNRLNVLVNRSVLKCCELLLVPKGLVCPWWSVTKTFFPWRKHAVGSDAPCETAFLIVFSPLKSWHIRFGLPNSLFCVYSVVTLAFPLEIVHNLWVLRNTFKYVVFFHDFQNRPVHLIVFMTCHKPSRCWIYKF